jgi:C4-dicarboxylate transporter DctQ subunit
LPLRILDGVTRIGYGAALLVLAAMGTAYCYEVGARYFFNAPTRWISDYVAYGLCVTIFLAVPELTRLRAHIAITYFLDSAPPQRARILQTIIAIAGAASCLVAAWISASESLRQFEAGEETIAAIPIPKWWVSVFITYGLLGAGLQFLRQALAPAAPAKMGTAE